MSENESGPCKGCIVYVMCDKLCDKATYYIKYSRDIDNWTWVILDRVVDKPGYEGI